MRYRVNTPQVINETIDGEAIMINLTTGSYYSLDRVGAEVWAFLEASVPVDGIVSELGRRYDADVENIRRGVDQLLEQLASEELIVLCDGDGPNGSGPNGRVPVEPAPATRQLFRAPQLEKFTDMQDLILLDPVHEVDSRGWPHLPDGHSATR